MHFLFDLADAATVAFAAWCPSFRRCSLPCPVWLRWMVALDNPFAKTNWVAEIISHMGLGHGMVLLDAGCDPGRLTIPLAEKWYAGIPLYTCMDTVGQLRR